MSLTFVNHYTSQVSICILWYTPDCPDGGDWSKAGWWNLSPGESKTPLGGDLTNRWYYFFAQAADGAYWAGVPHTTVPWRKFNWCINTSSTDARDVGFRDIDTGPYLNFTYTLTP